MGYLSHKAGEDRVFTQGTPTTRPVEKDYYDYFVDQRWSQGEQDYTYTAIALGGEAGEVQNEIKKLIRDDKRVVTDARREKIALELGDTLFYLTKLAHQCGYSLNSIMKMNIDKLVKKHGVK